MEPRAEAKAQAPGGLRAAPHSLQEAAAEVEKVACPVVERAQPSLGAGMADLCARCPALAASMTVVTAGLRS